MAGFVVVIFRQVPEYSVLQLCACLFPYRSLLGLATLRVSFPSSSPEGPLQESLSLRGICRTACATSLSARRGALANYLKLTALRPLGFSRTSPYRSKLLTALYEKSPALRAELQIVCGEGGIRTPGAFQLNSFQDCRNRPLYHLSRLIPSIEGVQR